MFVCLFVCFCFCFCFCFFLCVSLAFYRGETERKGRWEQEKFISDLFRCTAARRLFNSLLDSFIFAVVVVVIFNGSTLPGWQYRVPPSDVLFFSEARVYAHTNISIFLSLSLLFHPEGSQLTIQLQHVNTKTFGMNDNKKKGEEARGRG
eukprot:gene7887-5512_t